MQHCDDIEVATIVAGTRSVRVTRQLRGFPVHLTIRFGASAGGTKYARAGLDVADARRIAAALLLAADRSERAQRVERLDARTEIRKRAGGA
jgi:hypothetical protein